LNNRRCFIFRYTYEGLIRTTTYNIIPWIFAFSISEVMNPGKTEMYGMVLLHITPFFAFGIVLPVFMLNLIVRWKYT